MYNTFEKLKCNFGRNYTKVRPQDYKIEIPYQIFCAYTGDQITKNIADSNLKGVSLDSANHWLWFTAEALEEYLFQNTMNKIITCIRQALHNIDNDVTTMYLVGGFGGCSYVYSKVNEETWHWQRKFTILQLEYPQLAVIRGAILWRKNPEVIKTRTVDATYGVLTNIPYDTNYNPIHKSYVDDNGDQQMAVFCSFIEKGDLLPTDEVITREFLPRQGSNGIHLRLLSSDKKAIQFPIDDDGKPTVTDIGTIDIAVPNPNNLPREECKVEVTMDFSGTEIQAKAKYVINNSEVKIVCDFLSQIEHNE